MLKVNEIFGPTIQGEGPSQGKEVMFIRLGFCNLKCIWCDTKYTWDWQHYDITKEIHGMSTEAIMEKLLRFPRCKSVVISGGEPMLQQNSLLPLVTQLYKNNYWVEVETNGTVIPQVQFFDLVDQFNCSPKLSNSGDTKNKRVRPKALNMMSQSPKVFFKFVISSEKDIPEVIEYTSVFGIKPEQVYLMPLGKTQVELKQTTAMTKELAEQNGFNFSSRLHVELWGQRRGI